MASAMSANTPSAYKMLFFAALLMPHTSQLCTSLWIVYHADKKRQHSFAHFAERNESDYGR